MDYTIETIGGSSYIIIRDGANIHQIPLEAISTWGTLLGQTDPGETLEAILQYQEPESGSNIWGGLYDAVNVSLDEMAKAGVPPEFAEELLQDTTSPFPTRETREVLEQVRAESAESIQASGTRVTGLDSLKAELSESYGQEIKDGRVSFIDKLQPVYEIEPSSGNSY